MNSNKLTYLLQQFGLGNRIVSNIETLNTILDTQIDYGSVNEIIDKEIIRGLNYLKSNL